MKKRKIRQVEDSVLFSDESSSKRCKSVHETNKKAPCVMKGVNQFAMLVRTVERELHNENCFLNTEPVEKVNTRKMTFSQENDRRQMSKNKRRLNQKLKASKCTSSRLRSESSSNYFDTMWWDRYSELLRFKEETGHCNVPQRYSQNKALGKWVHKQRQEFKKKNDGEVTSMPMPRVEALRKIGFQSTTCNRAEALWQKRFNELVIFKRECGHCNVPQKYAPNLALGKWVHRQRHEFKKMASGESTFLTPQRIEFLEKIGFDCMSKQKQQAIWHQRCVDLEEYWKKKGLSSVSQAYPPNVLLGKSIQRSQEISFMKNHMKAVNDNSTFIGALQRFAMEERAGSA